MQVRPFAVLVVEDDAISATVLQDLLRHLGYDPYAVASTMEEALARASERCPDVVLMDIQLEGGHDGVETARRLKARLDVPVIFLTVHEDRETIDRATLAQPDGYLTKPPRASELQSAIEHSVHRHAALQHERYHARAQSAAMRSSSDAVLGVDLAGRITLMNPAAELLTGVRANDAMGKPAHDIVPALSLHAPHPEPERIEPVDGVDPSLGTVMVFRNVSDRDRIRQQLEFTNQLATLGTMAAGILHEINNPLSIIVGNAEMVAEELAAPAPDTAQSRQLLAQSIADILRAAQQIGAIAADLRTFSRSQPMASGAVDLVGCLEWALRTCDHELRARAKVSTLFGSLPRVAGDSTKLSQVFINLLLNAAQAIAPGDADNHRVVVSTTRDARGWAVVEISDTGCGIPAEQLSQIFEPFYTTKPSDVGTGLGLSISRGIVSAHHGEIDVHSEVGRGTRFRVALPPAQEPAQPAAAQRVVARRGRVLLVDDESMVLRFVARMLDEHEVVSMQDPRAALTLLARDPHFDVIICDINMPHVSGIELHAQLLSRDPDLASRMLFTCGGAVDSEMAHFLQSIPNPRLEKPFKPAELRQLVRAALQRARGGTASLAGTSR